MNRTAIICTSIATLGLLGAAALVTAGPLDPPAGPVSSTLKTLAEVEPRIAISATNTPGDANSLFKLTQPGSYYLTGNITGVAGKHGIEIAASGVTVDLMGFDLVGVAGMGAFDGVTTSVPGLFNVSVVNGSIRNWGGDGVDFRTAFVEPARVERIMVVANAAYGIRAGFRGTVVQCAAYGNLIDGIDAGDASAITRCVANEQGGHGIRAGGWSTVSGCSATGNSGNGFFLEVGGTITASSSGLNTGPGIGVSNACSVIDCTVSSSQSDGIRAPDGCSVSGCTVNSSAGIGISANNGCRITGNMVRNSQLDGIRVNFSCVVADNNLNGDGAAPGTQGAIAVIGQANRVDGNTISYADRGVYATAGGNVVVRNTVKGCTVNFDIVGGNDVGPIGPAATAASPWANIQY